MRLWKPGLVLSILIFASILIAGNAWCGEVRDLETLLKNEKSELDSLRRKIESNNRKLSSMGKEENNLLKTLENLQDQSRLRERELRIYHWNMEINQKNLDRLSANIKKYESQLERQKDLIAMRLRTIYKEGDQFLVRLLFSSDNFSDLVQNIKYMENVMSYDSTLFHEYNQRLEQLLQDRKQLEASRVNMARLEEAAQGKKQELDQEQDRKARFLKSIQTRQGYLIQVRKELMKAQGNLNDLITRLEKQQVLGKADNLEDVRGRLAYPVVGQLLSRFGKTRDKQYGTYILHNGINLKAAAGTPVRSIFKGKVLYTGSLDGYGNLIILGHGHKYHSLYGHLSRILVTAGETVSEGQVLGESGDSGSLLGENLYFELRYLGKPVDPTQWFMVAGK